MTKPTQAEFRYTPSSYLCLSTLFKVQKYIVSKCAKTANRIRLKHVHIKYVYAILATQSYTLTFMVYD